MQLVETAEYFPGCCALGGGATELVDFQRAMPAQADGAHMYVAQQLIQDAARLMGMRTAAEWAGLETRLREAEHRADELRELRDQHTKLRAAVRVTLDAGATIDQRTGEKKLRLPSGVKREEVTV